MPVHLSEPQAGIALITIDQPAKRNALGLAEFNGLAHAWEALAARADLRCVVITGAGDKAFCAGAQLDADFSGVGDVNDMVDRALLKTRGFPVPIVAAVNGDAVAGGFELMLAADLRVASRDARLGLPEVRWGIVPSGGGAMKLLDQIGHAAAMRLLLTGELLTADEALALGLLNAVVPAPRVLDEALGLAAAIASNSPAAVRATRALALAARQRRWREQEPQERVAADAVRASADAREGRAAFLERRAALYGKP